MKKLLIVSMLFIGGLVSFIIKLLSNEYVDSSGVLHEKFYLLAVGYNLIFVGIILLAIVYIKKKI